MKPAEVAVEVFPAPAVRVTGEPTSHADVIAASQRGATDVARLIEGIIANIDTPLPSAGDVAPASDALPEEVVAP